MDVRREEGNSRPCPQTDRNRAAESLLYRHETITRIQTNLISFITVSNLECPGFASPVSSSSSSRRCCGKRILLSAAPAVLPPLCSFVPSKFWAKTKRAAEEDMTKMGGNKMDRLRTSSRVAVGEGGRLSDNFSPQMRGFGWCFDKRQRDARPSRVFR